MIIQDKFQNVRKSQYVFQCVASSDSTADKYLIFIQLKVHRIVDPLKIEVSKEAVVHPVPFA